MNVPAGNVGNRPSYIAHFVIRTSRFSETLQWYKNLLDAHEVYHQPGLCFLTYDEEHHRLAIVEHEYLSDFDDAVAGIDHVALAMESISDLADFYERAKSPGIVPFWCINHGPTTSLYYQDPNGARIEFQCDQISYPGGAAAFFASAEFAKNPLGIEFDPDELFNRVRKGEAIESLLARPDTI
jgi:catechol 2,3-dioxygenase-like lactoylglutathione lyase family enzyme